MGNTYFGHFAEAGVAEDVGASGWLRQLCGMQRHGLTGHLEVAGFPFNSKCWAQPDIPFRKGTAPWWPYEQTAYWVDGFTRLGFLADAPELTAKAREQVEYVLAHADTDGYLGPRSCKAPMDAGRWSHAIFFRALIAYFDATGDPRIPKALARHYLGHRHDYAQHRDVCNIEIMCWAYAKTGNRKLLAMAESAWLRFLKKAADHDRGLRPEEVFANRPAATHGVTYLETMKQGAILYLHTGKKAYLDYSRAAMAKIVKHHMLVDGVPSSTECLRTTTSLDGHETCDIADFLWTTGYLLLATGEGRYADAMERAFFNGFPGAITKDFRQLQYFSAPNQVILSRESNHMECAFGGQWMCYCPKPGTECCTGEVNRILPLYMARMWMLKDGNPVASLYGPSRFTFQKGGQEVTIHEETQYPFGEEIAFSVASAQPVDMTLALRIPAWCKKPRLFVNGVERKSFRGKGFFDVKRVFQPGDRISLLLPMDVSVEKSVDGGVSIFRGPILFALPVAARRTVNRLDPHQSPEFPALELFPKGDWQYAMDVAELKQAGGVEVEFQPSRLSVWEHPQVCLKVPAHVLKGWDIDRRRKIVAKVGKLADPAKNVWVSVEEEHVGNFRFTPPIPDRKSLAGMLAGKTTELRLVPYGTTLLRVAIFPVLPAPSRRRAAGKSGRRNSQKKA